MVLDETGIPITGADVRLEGNAGVIEPVADSGSAVYFMAKPGLYTLRAGLAGYKEARQQVTVESFDSMKIKRSINPLFLRLEKQQAEQ